MFRRRGGGGGADGPQQPVGPYEDLRNLALLRFGSDVSGVDLGAHPDVVGAVVDLPGSNGGHATIVALADGTTSMYTSTGGGVIGAGEHAPVAAAALALLDRLQEILDLIPADDRTDLPSPEYLAVTVLTPAGRRRAHVPHAAFMGQEPSSVVPLLAAIHDVITAIRTHTPGY